MLVRLSVLRLRMYNGIAELIRAKGGAAVVMGALEPVAHCYRFRMYQTEKFVYL